MYCLSLVLHGMFNLFFLPRVKPKIVKSVFAASLQSSKHLVVGAKTGCFRNQDIVSEWIIIFTLGLCKSLTNFIT
jgi:hypothetical protein